MSSFAAKAGAFAVDLRGTVSSHPHSVVAEYQLAAVPSGMRTPARSPLTVTVAFVNAVSNRYATPSWRAARRTPQSPKSTNVHAPVRSMADFL